eukprot:COSAG02_NODE_1759_length_11042_cov_3.648725_3_plen_109_part_00
MGGTAEERGFLALITERTISLNVDLWSAETEIVNNAEVPQHPSFCSHCFASGFPQRRVERTCRRAGGRKYCGAPIWEGATLWPKAHPMQCFGGPHGVAANLQSRYRFF